MEGLRPFEAAVVREIPITTREQREHAAAEAGYNPGKIPARLVTIDCFSDSGTGAPSVQQKARAEEADERYAGSDSWHRFRDAVRALFPFPHILPVHQGRAGERVLFSALLKPGQISVSNTHFDTTSANVDRLACEARNLPCPEALDLDSEEPFKGNIDLDKLESILSGPDGSRVGQILVTITNNGLGGQPVSMANLEATSVLARRYGVPLVIDAARFAENAALVIQREPGYDRWTPIEVTRHALEFADACLVSLKKDGLAPEGGFIGLRDKDLTEHCEEDLIITEGHDTYGGMSGNTLECAAQGLREVVDPLYLADRKRQADLLAQQALDAGIDIVRPAGLHAIYLNASRLFPHLQPRHFPGHALACQLYLEGGIRAAELGSLYLGTLDDDHNVIVPAPFDEMTRLTIRRRTFDDNHIHYIGRVLQNIAKAPDRVPGYRLTHAPKRLRHFRFRCEPIPETAASTASS
jgi:tryptophanase